MYGAESKESMEDLLQVNTVLAFAVGGWLSVEFAGRVLEVSMPEREAHVLCCVCEQQTSRTLIETPETALF